MPMELSLVTAMSMDQVDIGDLWNRTNPNSNTDTIDEVKFYRYFLKYQMNKTYLVDIHILSLGHFLHFSSPIR